MIKFLLLLSGKTDRATVEFSTRRAMVRMGLVIRDDNGDWKLTDAGKEEAERVGR